MTHVGSAQLGGFVPKIIHCVFNEFFVTYHASAKGSSSRCGHQPQGFAFGG
jgi:hypothetical protein